MRIPPSMRIRFRVVGSDGYPRSGLLDTRELDSCRYWVGGVKDGSRQILYEVPSMRDDEGNYVRPGLVHWLLVETALEPKLDVFNAEEAIDEASTARKLTPEQARRWFDDKPFDPPESLAMLQVDSRRTTPSMPHLQPAHTDLQCRILEALRGKALPKDGLASAAGLAIGSDLYRKKPGGGLHELTARGEVRHLRGRGYYRPDAPPPSP